MPQAGQENVREGCKGDVGQSKTLAASRSCRAQRRRKYNSAARLIAWATTATPIVCFAGARPSTIAAITVTAPLAKTTDAPITTRQAKCSCLELSAIGSMAARRWNFRKGSEAERRSRVERGHVMVQLGSEPATSRWRQREAKLRRVFGAFSLMAATATPALACAPINYVDTAATAQVRTPSGVPRSILVEASGDLLRLEYASRQSPTGRVAVVGKVDSTEVFWFALGRGAPPAAHKTSWELVHAAIGLPPPRMLWDRYAAEWAPSQKWRNASCRPAIGDWGYNGKYDTSVCVHIGTDHRQGFPLYVTSRSGSVLFDVVTLSHKPLSPTRFRPPQLRTAMSSSVGCGG